MADVVVVGAGIGGLAVAARLAKLGHTVTVCERGDAVGGLLRPVACDGYGWETVGSLTLPAVLRDLFRKSGRPIERYLDLQLRSPARRTVFANGAVVDLPTGSRSDQTEAVASALGRAAGEEWTAFIDAHADVWDVLRQRVLDPVDGLARIAERDVARAVGARTSLSAVLRRWLPDGQLRLLAAQGALIAGGDPRRLPGFVAVEPYVERTFGVWEVVGGVGRLVEALLERLAERGVQLRLGWEVAQIDVDADRVTGVRSVTGERLAADLVVTCVAVRQVATRLLARVVGGGPARRLVTAEPLPGPSVSHLGLRGDLPPALLDEVVWYGDPLLVLRRGTTAPAGHTAVTLLRQSPPAAPPRWPWSRPSQHLPSGRSPSGNGVQPDGGGRDVLEVLARRGLDLRPQVVCRLDRSAAALEAAGGGSPYGLAWSGVRAAAERARLATPVAGLFCLGAGLPLPATVPYVAWHAATLATAIGKA